MRTTLFAPPVVWVHRRPGLRAHDGLPTAFEVLFHLVVWSICFEVIAPQMPHVFRTTADPFDVVAYAVGAGIASLLWRHTARIRRDRERGRTPATSAIT